MPPKHGHRATPARLATLDVFSGIGSFSLALEALGCYTVGYCDIHEDSCAVLHARMREGRLRKEPVFPDVRELQASHLEELSVDAICALRPCSFPRHRSYR